MNGDDLLTAFDLAEILRLPAVRITRLAKAGEIPCVELPGGEVRFLLSDIRQWLEARRRPATAGGGAA